MPGIGLAVQVDTESGRLLGDPDLDYRWYWFYNNLGIVYYPEHNIRTLEDDPTCLPQECDPDIPTYSSRTDADIDATDV